MDTNEFATETPQAQRSSQKYQEMRLVSLLLLRVAMSLWHKYYLVLCLAEFLETLAISLMISLDHFVLRRQAQPISKAVHNQVSLYLGNSCLQNSLKSSDMRLSA